MFESEEVLGRRIDWAFAGPQLLVVPRAGNWKSAYYERESRRLQFNWRTMNKLHHDPGSAFQMSPIDFLKVSHHGSHNGTPDDDIVDLILPVPNPQPGRRVTGVSTSTDTYNNGRGKT